MTPAERALLLAVAKELKDRFDVLHTLIAAVEAEAAPKADLSGMDRIIANTTADEIASMVEAANDAELLGLLDRIKALEEAYDQLQEHRSRDLDELTAERDEAREAVRRLVGVVVNIQGNARQDVVRWDCESALADPVVRRIVEGG